MSFWAIWKNGCRSVPNWKIMKNFKTFFRCQARLSQIYSISIWVAILGGFGRSAKSMKTSMCSSISVYLTDEIERNRWIAAVKEERVLCVFLVLQYCHTQYDKADPLGVLGEHIRNCWVSLRFLLPLVHSSH